MPHPVPDRALAVRIYRWLLIAYPRRLREEEGEQLQTFFAERYRDARELGGWVGAVDASVRAFWDVIRSGLIERVEASRKDEGGNDNPGESMERIVRDARHALRRLSRSPGFAVVVLLTLGLGIGANTAIFSVMNALLWKPLPYDEPDRLVALNHLYPSLDLEASVSARGFRDYRTNIRSFATMAAWTGWGADLTGVGEPERLSGALVTPAYFETVGVPALLGRTFGAEVESEGEVAVTVLSHGLWTRRFGADSDVLGRSIVLNGTPYTVIGVMPASFKDVFNRNVELWAPLILTEEHYARGYTNEWLATVARLAPGVDEGQGASELAAFADRLKADTPDEFAPDWSILQTSLSERARRDLRPALRVLFASVVFVLLIACANVANLLLARSATRRQELAVRVAVGASSGDIVRQLLADGLVLGVAGAGVGLVIGWAGLQGLIAITAGAMPELADATLDRWVLLFALSVSLATGLLVGLTPALRAARPDVQSTIRDGDRSRGDRSGLILRRAFVISQFALALALLAGAGLLMRSMARLQAVDPGFQPEGVVTFQLSLPASRYPSQVERRAFFDETFAELEGVPGVESVGGTSVLPFSGNWSTSSFEVEGYEPAPGTPGPWGDSRIVTPGFHEAMGLELVRGRYLSDADGPETPLVAVVDAGMVEQYWPDENPIGKRIRYGEAWIEVVGVVTHSAHEGLDADPRVQVYRSHGQFGVSSLFVAVRTAGDPITAVPGLRDVVRRSDADLPLARLATMEQLIDDSVGPRRLSMLLLGLFAALALLLAATGIYGVMAQLVNQRTRELGVRMAMGAGRSQVLGMVLRQGMTMAVVGVAVGLVGALALTQVVRAQLFGVEPTDPATYAAVVLLLLSVATSATLLPALRATRVDPVTALREE